MKFEDGLYLKGEENNMTSEGVDCFDINKLLPLTEVVLDTYAQNVKINHQLETQKNRAVDNILNISDDIYNSIPDSAKSFKQSNKSKESSSFDLSQKIDLVNKYAIISTKIVAKMINNIEDSKNHIQNMSGELDSIIKMYKEGSIISKKDSIKVVNNLKETLDMNLSEISELKKMYFQEYEKTLKLKIPQFSKDFIKPNYLANNRRGLYLPKRLKSYMEVKNDLNKFDISSFLHKQTIDFEQKLKSHTQLNENLTYKDLLKVYRSEEKLKENNSKLVFDIDINNGVNFIISDSASYLVDSLEHDAAPKNCFYHQTKGFEKQYDEMIGSLNQIIKQLKNDERQLNKLSEMAESLSKYSEKAVDKAKYNLMHKRNPVDKMNVSKDF